MTWVTEFVGILVVVGALVLLGLGKIDFQQSISLMMLGAGIIGGKQLGHFDMKLTRRYADLYMMRKFRRYLTALAVTKNSVSLYVAPEYLESGKVADIVKVAEILFPGKIVEVKRGERIRAV